MGRGAYFRYNDSFTATNPMALYGIWKEPPTVGPPNPYAPWSNYYIIYYTNGGSGFMDMQAVSRTSPTVALNTVNSSYFYREGATFDHWDTRADDEGTDYSDGQTGVTLSGNITLFAIWKFNVTYDGNGSTGGSVPVVDPYAKGSTVTVLGNTGSLVKTGYVFNGWNTEADGSGTQYAAGDTFTITEGVVLYAQWVFAITVTFDKNK
ncbi:MAG: InlB B-repeat-containing protein [Candidatus Methanomethylophilaceae archaeon]|nr:InlB B-repeat-containing protein [Candidatus Methanomethylophilaceae archaeon]